MSRVAIAGRCGGDDRRVRRRAPASGRGPGGPPHDRREDRLHQLGARSPPAPPSTVTAGRRPAASSATWPGAPARPPRRGAVTKVAASPAPSPASARGVRRAAERPSPGPSEGGGSTSRSPSADGCGTADWQTLQPILGDPARSTGSRPPEDARPPTTTAPPVVYQVQRGDTLTEIARHFHTTVGPDHEHATSSPIPTTWPRASTSPSRPASSLGLQVALLDDSLPASS